MDAERTEIGTLGEFGLIAELTKGLESKQEGTILGVGDDAAVLSPAAGMQTLVSTDLLCEGIHFDLTYSPLKHLGYKAVVVNLSDICAMNGTPRQIVVGLACPTGSAWKPYKSFTKACAWPAAGTMAWTSSAETPPAPSPASCSA